MVESGPQGGTRVLLSHRQQVRLPCWGGGGEVAASRRVHVSAFQIFAASLPSGRCGEMGIPVGSRWHPGCLHG